MIEDENCTVILREGIWLKAFSEQLVNTWNCWWTPGKGWWTAGTADEHLEHLEQLMNSWNSWWTADEQLKQLMNSLISWWTAVTASEQLEQLVNTWKS